MGINQNHVSILDSGNRAADSGFGSDVADHQPMRCAGEAAIRHQTDLIAKTLTMERTGNGKHLAHTGTAARAFVADDNDIAGFDLGFKNRLHGVFFAFENTRGSLEPEIPHAGHLHDAALGSEVAFQDADGAGRANRL